MSERFQQKHPSYLDISEWTNAFPDLVAGMTTRVGGAGEPPFDSFNLGWHVPDNQDTIRHNREMLASLLQFPLKSWVGGEQVHDTKIHTVTQKDKGKGAFGQETAIPSCDGLITKESNILLTAFFADCVPLFFYDPQSSWIGIAHAGWKGTVSNMGPKMVQALENQGVDSKSLRVGIGPSISGDMYEVDENVIRHIPDKFQRPPIIETQTNGRYLLSLQHMHVELLLEAGIEESHIEQTEYCTYQSDHLFFSHRRDQGKTGRMLGFIGLKGS